MRLVIADDDPDVLEAFVRVLRREYDVVAAAHDGESALAEAVKLVPDVVVCDISMPGRNGFEVARELQRLCPTVRIVFLTMHSDPAFVSEAVRMGVAGYVLKSSGASALLAAVRAAAKGETYVSPSLRPGPQSNGDG